MELYVVSGIAKYIIIEHVAYIALGLTFIAIGIGILKQCMNLAKKIKK